MFKFGLALLLGGAYFTVGKDALVKTISATIFGAVLAGIAVLIHTYVGMLGDFAWPVAVGITVWGLTAVPKFSDVPANVFGYAATFGLMLLTNSADMYSIMSVAVSNPVITASISFILGSLAGMVSEKVAGMLG